MDKPKQNSYRLDVTGKFVKVYINDVLHVQFQQGNFVGFQSWKEGKNWFVIEVYFKKDFTITLEYDRQEKWEAILKLMDDNLS